MGGIQNQVDRRLRDLSRELRAIIVQAELGNGTPARRRRKLERVDKAAQPLITEAFRDIDVLTRNALGRMAVTDAQAVENAIAAAFESVPSG